MARRLLDTSFWDDQDVAALCVEERLLLICMMTDTSLTDDFGVLPASPAALRKHAFGYDDYTIAQVQAWRDNIVRRCKNVVLFEVGGQAYIFLKNFEKYQGVKYQRVSTNPPPPSVDQPFTKIGEIVGQTSEPFGEQEQRIVLSCVDLSCVDMSSVVVDSPGADDHHDTAPADPLAAQFHDGLKALGAMVTSQAQDDAYRAIVDDIRSVADPPAFIEQLMTEAAATTSGRITPRWFEAVVDRCIREGRMPGDKRQVKGRDGPSNGSTEHSIDEWAAIAAQFNGGRT
jgi:hypothetical protein